MIRTSTGHGTAFDIAGRNIADASNLVKAIELAAELGIKRRITKEEGDSSAC
ncbi:MAG: hypothetical protein FIA99_17155 [Ruminiclostridium sp.]|nr:hypothetical protein [Ruminiclostridium sp.]